MSVVSVQRGFSPSTATLSSVAQRLLEALQNETIGTPLVSHLSPTFVADFTAQIALVAKLDADQHGATGSVGSLVQSQAKALAEFLRLASVARRAARLAFPGEDTLLRSAFEVGVGSTRDLPAVLERARRLLVACQRSEAALAPYGWSSTTTEVLARAVEGLTTCNRQREQEGDGKLGVTAGRIVAANRLYRQCLTVQNVARLVYADGSIDSPSIEARARFLLGEFPRRVPPVAAPLPVAPVATVPTPVVAAAA